MNPIRRAARIELGRRSFWYYCKAISPDFYRDDRPHLRLICDVLQALYEGRIVRYRPEDIESGAVVPDQVPGAPVVHRWYVVRTLTGREIEVCKKYMQNMPPQHGKTRTLVNFSTWVFGMNPKEKIITGSYNDTTASDFSRYTRDAITTTSIDESAITYADIFPKTRIKRGNSGFEKWALEGSHFSYMGVGIGGSVTSKGGGVLIFDDPIKGAEEAFNENVLEKVWLFYSSTFSSRVATDQGEPFEILNMTRWSHQDPCGRILSSADAENWYVITLKAYDETTDSMLCPSLLSRRRYESQKILVEEQIFNANYQQETREEKGTLFPSSELNRFSMPEVRVGEREDALGYIDVADQGDDSLSNPIGYVYPAKVFIPDVVFTAEDVEVTVPLCASKAIEHKVSYTRIESNNQGKLFRSMLADYLGMEKLLSVTNSTNKHTRILMMAGFIKQYFYFLHPSEIKPGSDYDKFMKQLCSYMRDGSSKKDDAPDSLAGLAKFIRSHMKHLFPVLKEVGES